MNKIHLSNWSITLLKTDNRKWYNSYVLGNWEDEFQTYLSIGACFARCMDDWSKTGDYNVEHNLEVMKKEYETAWESEKVQDAIETVIQLIDNVKVLELAKPLESEKEVIVDLNDRYDLKCKFDALYKDCILDHKTVSAFTKEEEKDEKYWMQMRLYQYAYYLLTGEKKKAIIQEIKKGKASIPTSLKKEDIEWLLPIELKGTLKTITEMKDYLRDHPIAEWVGNRLEFPWDDNLLVSIDTLIRRAIVRADYLRTIENLDDIL